MGNVEARQVHKNGEATDNPRKNEDAKGALIIQGGPESETHSGSSSALCLSNHSNKGWFFTDSPIVSAGSSSMVATIIGEEKEGDEVVSQDQSRRPLVGESDLVHGINVGDNVVAVSHHVVDDKKDEEQVLDGGKNKQVSLMGFLKIQLTLSKLYSLTSKHPLSFLLIMEVQRIYLNPFL